MTLRRPRLAAALSAAALAAVAACGGGTTATPAAQEPTTAAPTCADAAATAAAYIAGTSTNPPTDAQRAELVSGLTAACVEDGWSAELRACVVTIEPDTKNPCDGLVTEAQHHGIGQRLGALLEALEHSHGDPSATDDEAGGSGQRHRGEEGKMGGRDDAPPPPPDDTAADPCEGGE